MPVIDTPVHEKTKIDHTSRYGCNNLLRTREPYLVKDGIYPQILEDGTVIAVQKLKLIEDTSTLRCHHDKSLSDPRCEGCEFAGTGEEYFKKVHEEGK